MQDGGPVVHEWRTNRKARLPANWDKLRVGILDRDGHRCRARMSNGGRCNERANQVDHIRPGDDHRPANLQSLCEWHHSRKSAAEGHAAMAKRRERIEKSYRRTEDHPGLL